MDREGNHGLSTCSWFTPSQKCGGPLSPSRAVEYHTSRRKARGSKVEPLELRHQTTEPSKGPIFLMIDREKVHGPEPVDPPSLIEEPRGPSRSVVLHTVREVDRGWGARNQ
uniref:Uncharacterized protein n=1 Tax=Solanum tuberosum TaxID=4113 RepID=M1DLX5_SOLTU